MSEEAKIHAQVSMSAEIGAASQETWPQLFSALLFHLSPLDIVRISTSSKAMRDFFLDLLTVGDRQLARALLLSSLEGAASSSSNSTAAELPSLVIPCQIRQHSRTVTWLIETAKIPPVLLELEAQKYICTSNLPLAVCKQLVAAGVTISYEQLVSAARDHVEGVDKWVLAYKSLAKPTSLGRLVEAVCCFNWQSVKGPMLADLSPIALADLLHIAINTQSHSSSPASTEAATATLSTVLGCMRRSAAVRQLSSDLLLQLLQSQVHVLSSRKIDSTNTHSCMAEFSFLLNSAADAGSLDSSAIEQLLLTAIQQRLDPPNLQYLLTLQAIRQLTAAGIGRLLQAELDMATAYGHGKLRESVVGRLCRLPASEYMSAEDCTGLCRALIGFTGRADAPRGCSQWYAEVYSVLRELISKLRALPGMKKLNAASVLQLLQFTVHVCKERKVQDSVPYSIVKLLCGLPASAAISSADLHELLHQAEVLGPAVLEVLRQLSAAW